MLINKLKNTIWKKVSLLKTGAMIAVVDSSGYSHEQMVSGAESRVEWDEIVSIKPLGKQHVYDIEIEGTHNFVGNGIIAHNTIVTGNLMTGGITGVNYNAMSDSGTAAYASTDDDLYVEDILEVGNTLYVNGSQIANYWQRNGTNLAPLNIGDNVGIGTTAPDSRLSVRGAATGPIQVWQNSSGTGLAAFDVSGNLGIGTTSPLQKLHVEGQCVTGDSLLPLISEGSDPSDISYTRIDQIKGGELVLSLNEKTGKLELQKIKGLLDMGIKPVYKLTTEDGKTIRTTGNHPYLARRMGRTGLLENNVDQSGGDNIQSKHDRTGIEELIKANAHNLDFLSSNNNPNTKLIIAGGKLNVNKPINFSKETPNNPGEISNIPNQPEARLIDKSASAEARTENETNLVISPTLAQWTKVIYLSPGDEIAVMDGATAKFVKIASIEYAGEEQVWDIEVANTHNFVANGIIAHNTYISGNLGIGTTQPGQKLDVAGSATVSANLTAGGQIQLGRFLSDPAAIGAGSLYFNTTDNKVYFYNSTAWAQVGSGSGAGSNWRITNGALSPINDTLDILFGSIATASAKFAFLNVNSGTPTASVSAGVTGAAYLTSAGALGTTAKQTLTLGSSTTGNINIQPASNHFTLIENNSGGAAALQVNQLGTGDIISASASGSTVFRLDTSGYAYYQRYADLANSSYYLDPATTGVGLALASGSITSGVTDSSTAVGFTLNSTNSLTTQGSKLLSLQNFGTEKFYIDKDGNLYAAGTIVSGNGTSMLLTNKSGGTVANRSIVVLDTTNNTSFTTTTTPYSKAGFGVVVGVGLGVANDADADGVCDANDICMIAYGGSVNVTVKNATTAVKGDYLFTSDTAGSAVASAKQYDGLVGIVNDTTNAASGYLKMIFKVQPQVTAAAAIDKTTKHNEYWLYADQYAAMGEGSNTDTNLLNRGLAFDTFADSTKIDSANTTVSFDANTKKTGLIGGQTMATSTTDNAGNTYLGSNTVNDQYYYDRTKDSTPQVQVELGIDPNWYNGVTLAVATSSAQFSQNSTVPAKNPNLSPSYNGSLIKVTGAYATAAAARTIYITIKSPTTFDWTDYNGQAATGVTMTPGTAQTLTGTGVSAKFTNARYNTGDVFKIASWFVEPSGSTRGAKAQFPERSTIIATASSIDIIDADTQKLWMRFSTGTNFALGTATTNTPNSVNVLNGKAYVAMNGATATGLYRLDFTADAAFRQNATDWRLSDQPLAQRNGTNTYNVLNTSNILVNATANDVSAAVIPNQPTQNVTVSGWGYIQGAAAVYVYETVNLPYKFNSAPAVVVGFAGTSSSAPTNLQSCATGAVHINTTAATMTTTSFLVAHRHVDATNLDANTYYCYTWTATGQVSPRQYVAVGTNNFGTSTGTGGVTIINETDQSTANISEAGWPATTIAKSVAFAGNDLYIMTQTPTGDGADAIINLHGVPGITTITNATSKNDGFYRYNTTPAVLLYDATTNSGNLSVTEGTSTIDGKSNTIYVGAASGTTNAGLYVIQEKQRGGATRGEGSDTNNGSVKRYTKDYISEEMVGDIRGMWPLYNNAANTTVTDVSVKGNNGTAQQNTSAISVTGVRGKGYSFNGSSDYINAGESSSIDGLRTSSWTISAWIKRAATGAAHTIVGRGDSVGAQQDRGFLFYVTNSDKLALFYRASAGGADIGLGGTKTIDTNWHYVTAVRNANTSFSFYIDGQLDAYGGTPADITAFTASRPLGIGAWQLGYSPGVYFNGTIDEVIITATALTAGQIKHMYEVGYRALQSHATTLGGGAADTNQQLGFIGAGTNVIGDAKPDYNNQFMYVGTNSTTLGAVSKIQLNSDTNIKTYNAAANVPAGGPLLIDEDTKSLAVGYNLEAVGSATTGVKTMGVDNNATATSGNFIGKTITTAESFNQAYLWAQYVTDSSDASNTIQVWASNDGGSNYYQCNLTNTDTSRSPAEYEYFCQFNTAGSSLKTKFVMARGSTKTNTYVTKYGISWIDSNAIAGSALGSGLYTTSGTSVANGSYIDVAHNQNSADLLTNGWRYNTTTSQWELVGSNNETATTIDLMEYSTDTAAQAAYVTQAVTSATGGTITTSGGYTIHTFTSGTSTFTPTGSGSVEYLVVAGGGGGGQRVGGGGGAGGLLYSSSYNVTSAQPYTVTVGAGGAGATSGTTKGVNGSNSSFGTITATGGGGGGSINNGVGLDGGSGGGGSYGNGYGYGTSGQGNNGGVGLSSPSNAPGGGGGGAGAAGQDGIASPLHGGNGGVGLAYNIGGSSAYYAGGGGGGMSGTPPGTGGNGGGGAGSGTAGVNATDGTANTGGGGGGGADISNGGAGGSGIVIVRYLTPPALIGYSEASLKTQGSYSLKGVATITTSLNKTLTRTVSPTLDLSGKTLITFDMRASRTGSNIKIGIHDSGGTTTEITPSITSANTYQTVSWDISAVANTALDAIDSIIVTITNADAANTFYIDNMFATPVYKIVQTDANTARLYNYSGAAQNLRLDVITGGLGRNAGTVSLSPAAADVDSQANVNSLWINKTGSGGNLLKLQASGTDQLTLSSAGQLYVAGNVGIGTTAPAELLDVAGRVRLVQTTAPATVTDKLYNVAGSLYWSGTNLSSGSSKWTAGTGDNIYRSLGNVGIGTTAPTALLHLGLGSTAVVGQKITLASGATANAFEVNSFTEVGGDKFLIKADGNVGIGTTAPGQKLAVNGNISASIYYDAQNTSYYLDPASTGNALLVAGNVGIGTTNPLQKLHVAGSAYFQLPTSGPFVLVPGAASPDTGSISFGDGTGWKFHFAKYSDGGATKFMTIQDNGNVGIGTASPGYTLTVSGTAWVTSGAWSGSDVRWKKDIQPIAGALDKVLQLSGISYNWRKDEFPENKFDDKTHLGLVAQNVENIVPELVTTGPDGYKGLDYNGLAPLLIGAIQEQQTQITSLSAQLAGMNLTSTGDLEIIDQENNYSVATLDDTIIDRIGAFAQLVAANIKAGYIHVQTLVVAGSIETKNLIADQIYLQGVSLQAYITQIVEEVLANKPKFLSPSVETEKLTTNFISPLTNGGVITITAPVIIGSEASGSAQPALTVQGNATISGELVAGSIKSSTIDLMRQKIEDIVAQLNQQAAAPPDSGTIDVNTLNALYELLNSQNQATASAQSLDLASVEADFGFFKDYLGVMGQAVITDLTVTNSLNVASITSPAGSLNLLAGLMVLDQSGNVLINGNLTVNGEVLAQKITAPQGHFEELLAQKLAVDAARIKKLTTDGLIIAGDASASAQTATSSASITTNATAGKAILPAGSTQLTINSPHVTAETLIYVTPIGDSQNQVLYVKAKNICKQGYEPCLSWFKVAINQPLPSDLEFNWWIIKLEPEKSI